MELGIIIIFALALITFVFYVKNIIKLFKLTSFSGEMVVRGIGIFIFPIGVIMGLIK